MCVGKNTEFSIKMCKTPIKGKLCRNVKHYWCPSHECWYTEKQFSQMLGISHATFQNWWSKIGTDGLLKRFNKEVKNGS
jgi:hypothetical protein